MDMTENSSDFCLSKWYMDCIDSDGNTFIGYSALLRWKKFKLNYANILLCDERGIVSEQTTLKKLQPPAFSENCFSWKPAKLKVAGTWNSIDKPIEKTLLNSDTGVIHWYCFQPKAYGNVKIADNNIITGFGYAEKLEMTIKPWELPFSELRWGRFLSAENSIIWVNWIGDTNLSLLLIDGNQMKETLINDDGIHINNGEFILAFSDHAVLRKGALISTALSNIPGLKTVFPQKVLNTYECKWRSKGVLKKDNKVVSEGWVIHEVVRWL